MSSTVYVIGDREVSRQEWALAMKAEDGSNRLCRITSRATWNREQQARAIRAAKQVGKVIAHRAA